MRRFAAVAMVVVAALLATTTACAQGTSTTSVTVGGDPVGGFYAEADVSIAGPCFWDAEDSTDGPIYVSIGNNNIYTGTGDYPYDTDAFVSTPGYPFGPGVYAVSGSFQGFQGDDGDGTGGCNVAGSSGGSSIVVPQSGSAVTGQFPTKATLEGQTLTLPVVVAPASSYGQYTAPTGSVSLLLGSQTITTLTLSEVSEGSGYSNYNGGATFSFSTTGLAPGNYAVQLAYSGDANYFPFTTAAQTITISPSHSVTSTVLTASPTTAVVGDTITLTATVTPAADTTPSGTITFSANGLTIGSASVNSSGVATLSESSKGIPAGTYPVVAKYNGDSEDLSSTSTAVSVTLLAQSATVTTLTVSPSTLAQGASVTLTVNVAQNTGSTPPGGHVTITANGASVATLTLTHGTASISVSTSGFPAGTYSVQAKYAGDATDAASSSTVETVTLDAAANVTASASPNPVTLGNETVLTTTVKNDSGAPITVGSVTFSISDNTLGTIALNSSGVAQLPLETGGLTKGTNSIQVSYSGSGNIAASGGTINLTVQ